MEQGQIIEDPGRQKRQEAMRGGNKQQIKAEMNLGEKKWRKAQNLIFLH